jgi:flagellar motor protein MotB
VQLALFPILGWSLLGCHHPAAPQTDLLRQLDAEVIALNLELRQCQQKEGGGGPVGAPAPVYAELNQVLDGSEARVTREGSVTEVTIPASLLFSGSSVRVRDEAGMVLDLVATAINLHPEYDVVVVGHTDDSKPPAALQKQFPSGWEYSAARAAAVARKLANTYAVDPARLTIAGRANVDAVGENDTPEGRAANRRVVVRLIPTARAASKKEVPPPAPPLPKTMEEVPKPGS